MDENRILDLYWQRDEQAIRETELAYGPKLQSIALRITGTREDAQECVSDTYLTAWQTIPPQRPQYLFAYLARICRNFALGLLDRQNAAKRSGHVVELTREMEQCIPDNSQTLLLEGKELGRLINRFLGEMPKETRMIFLRRYFYADSVEEIARRFHITQSKVKTTLYRTRQKLAAFLEKEGVSI